MTSLHYFSAFNVEDLLRDYPIAQDFIDRYAHMSRDELRSIQEKRFRSCMARGWQIPFYARHWGAKGIEPGDFPRSDGDLKLDVRRRVAGEGGDFFAD